MLSHRILILFILKISYLCLVTCNIETIEDHDMTFWYRSSYVDVGQGEQWEHPLKYQKTWTSTSTSTGENYRQWLVTKHITPKVDDNVPYISVDFELQLTGQLTFYVLVNRTVKFPSERDEAQEYILKYFERVSQITISNSGDTSRNHTFDFHYTPYGSGVTFAVHSSGAIGKILRIKMYYHYCPGYFMNSVKYPRTISPPVGDAAKKVNGSCSHNSITQGNTTQLRALCLSNGNWVASNNHTCLCMKGYEPNENKGCIACATNHYKEDDSNSQCLQCSLSTISVENKTRCECKKGYVKLNDESQNSSFCYAPLVMKRAATVSRIKRGVLNITWHAPETSGYLNYNITYDVDCLMCIDQTDDCMTTCDDITFTPMAKDLKQDFVVVSKLALTKRYLFKIYPKNRVNHLIAKEDWNYSAVYFSDKENDIVVNTTPVFEEDEPNERKKDTGIPLHIILFAIAGVLVVVIALLVIVILKRRKSDKKYNQSLLLHTELPSTGHRTYVDPSNYENPEDALGEFACELNPGMVQAEMLIGGGEFGDVYKGIMIADNNERTSVALKTLKANASPKSEKDFLLEASIIGQFKHPNVITLIGVVSRQTPRMIVLEFMANGSLDHFLKINDSRLPQKQLITMSQGVASGMQYLESMDYVHRDLAARNILVNEAMVCKVSDFGLSRHLETTDSSRGEYSTTGGKIPMRWTAPEAIKYRKFSSASDVWSFGILLWEIMSFAERPYWDWNNYRVIEEVDNGYRLPAPLNCPKGVHDLMLHCWSANRGDRPNFTSIVTVINAWLESTDSLSEDIALLTLLGQWLKRLKMEAYVSNFLAAGYDRPSQIIDLTNDDLKAIGIQLVGHRNKILKGLKALNEMQKSRGLKREVSLEV